MYDGHRAGHDPAVIARFRGGLSRTFQTPVLVDSLTVEENLQLAYRSSGERFRALLLPFRADAAERSFNFRLESMVSKLRLESLRSMRAELLSFGMRRLVATAVALLASTRVVLLDEPFANVDPGHRDLLENVITEEARAQHRCILMIEHAVERKRIACANVLYALGDGLSPIPASLPVSYDRDVLLSPGE